MPSLMDLIVRYRPHGPDLTRRKHRTSHRRGLWPPLRVLNLPDPFHAIYSPSLLAQVPLYEIRIRGRRGLAID
jgi:hypothetical protein